MKRLITIAVALTLVATSCTYGGDDAPISASGSVVSTAQVLSLTITPPSATATTVAIVSPLAPPTGEVIATGVGWELTDREFEELVDFAARAMQQSFPDPVAVEVLGATGVTDLTPAGSEFVSPIQWDLLRALGLATDSQSLAEVNEVRRQRLRGNCCLPVDDTLTVRVEDAGSEVLTKLVMMHELVHALLTQSPPLGRVPDEAFDEPVDVVSAAVEGVPQWVEMRYHASLSEVDREAIAEELPIIRSIDLEEGVPPAAAELLAFGYVRGPALVDGLFAAGVNRPYDQVVDRFPATSEQVLFPAIYFEAQIPVVVPPPSLPSGVVETASGRLGSLYLMMVVETVVDEETALELVRPWAGDAYAQWSDGARSCVAVDIVMDDEPSAIALSDVLQIWAAEQAAASAEMAGPSISLNSCTG